MIRRQAPLTTKGLSGQGSQTMITGTTYGALIARKQDIHKSGAGNSMERHQHLAKGGATMKGNRGIMGKHTCPLYNQLKEDPWNKTNLTKMRLKI